MFFQIVHTRLPLLNPAQFRSRLQLLYPPTNSSSNNSEKPLHPALVATVLAWGSKFSEHPLLAADRRRPGGQSLLAKALIDRARDLAEALKVHRVATAEHVVIGLLIEPLQSRQFIFPCLCNFQSDGIANQKTRMTQVVSLPAEHLISNHFVLRYRIQDTMASG